MRKDRDVRFRDVAPAAKISITQFNKIVWTLFFVVPPAAGHLAAFPINCHKRSRSQQRMHRVVFKTDIGIRMLPRTAFEKESGRNLTPKCDNSVDKLSGFPLESRIEPHRNRHFCVEVVKLGRNRSRCGQLNFLTISVGSIRIYSIAGQNLVKRKSINRSQCEYLEHTRYYVVVFDL